MDLTSWHGGGMWIFWILVLVAVALVSYWLGRRGERRGSWMTPEERLKDLFGRHEISAEEYERRLRELKEGNRDSDAGVG